MNYKSLTSATEEWPVDGPVCVVCLGNAAVPIPAYAVAPGGPDTYPLPVLPIRGDRR
jgi:hypothetical protein